MATRVLTFWTPQYNTYQVRLSDGAIRPEREYRMNKGSWSGQWKLLGIRHTKRTRDFMSFDVLVGLLEAGEKIEWLFRTSRNPQWTVEDHDHGTRRTWGNTQYHGIAGMRFELLYDEREV